MGRDGAHRTILITSIGSLVGRNILDSIESMRSKLRVIGVNSEPLAANNFRCDVCYLAPLTADRDGFCARLRDIIELEQPDLVLAGRDDDLVPLARLKAIREFPRTLILTPDAAAVDVVNDKYATAQFARRHGLPYPETAATWKDAERLIDRCGFPLICKPRSGFASRGVTIIRNHAQACAAITRSGFVLQEYLCPPPDLDAVLADARFGTPLVYRIVEADHYSGQAMVGAAGEMLTFFACAIRRDDVIIITPVDEPAFRRVTEDYVYHLAGLGFVGPLNLNCKRLPDGRFVPHELNGRFTGATSSRALFGYSEVMFAIHHFLDGRPIAWSQSVPSDQIVTRLPSHHLMRLSDVERLRTAGVWQSSSRSE